MKKATQHCFTVISDHGSARTWEKRSLEPLNSFFMNSTWYVYQIVHSFSLTLNRETKQRARSEFIVLIRLRQNVLFQLIVDIQMH